MKHQPCPFCGSEDLELEDTGAGCHITCFSCFTTGPLIEEVDGHIAGEDNEEDVEEVWRIWDTRVVQR